MHGARRRASLGIMEPRRPPVLGRYAARTAGVLAALVSGLAEPLGAVLAWLFLRRLFTPGFLNGTVVLAAGVMVWVALAQLLPGALHPAHRTAGILGAAVGCLLMLLGIAALP